MAKVEATKAKAVVQAQPAKGLPTDQEVRDFIAGLCERDDIPLSKFFRQYWIEHLHVTRLPFLLHRLAPLIKTDDALFDVGSFGEWSLMLWKYLGLSRLFACSLEGGYLAYGKGELKKQDEADKEFEILIDQVDVENEPLRYEDNSLDVITCFEVLEHLRYDPVFLMKEFNRVLKPNGLLILTTPYVNSYVGLLRMVEYKTPHIFSQYFPDRQGIGHCKEYAVSEVKQLFYHCGFEMDAVETFDYHPPLGLTPQVVGQYQDLKSCLQSHGWDEELARQTILVIGRKTGEVEYRYYDPLYTVTEAAAGAQWLPKTDVI
jgi:SAM-dependent methyltransferase